MNCSFSWGIRNGLQVEVYETPTSILRVHRFGLCRRESKIMAVHHSHDEKLCLSFSVQQVVNNGSRGRYNSWHSSLLLLKLANLTHFIAHKCEKRKLKTARPLVTWWVCEDWGGNWHRCFSQSDTGTQHQLWALGQTDRVTIRNRNITIAPLIGSSFCYARGAGSPVCISSLKPLTQFVLHTNWFGRVILKVAGVCLLLMASAGSLLQHSTRADADCTDQTLLLQQDLAVSTSRSFFVHISSSSHGTTGVLAHPDRHTPAKCLGWGGKKAHGEGRCPRIKRQLVLLIPQLQLSAKQKGDGLHHTFSDSPGGKRELIFFFTCHQVLNGIIQGLQRSSLSNGGSCYNVDILYCW